MTCSTRVRVLVMVVLGTAAAARPAHAEGFVNAGLGISFGSSAAQGRANFVGAIGWLPREPIGVELDVTYAPSFFKNPGSFTENRLTTVMANVMFAGIDHDRGGFFRRRRRERLRPYVSGGFGLMSERVDSPDGRLSDNHLGVNLGVGVIALPREDFGIRADIRFFQDLIGTTHGSTSGIDFGSFHFWRASIGFAVAF